VDLDLISPHNTVILEFARSDLTIHFLDAALKWIATA
jgi:hypothetical protein